DYEAARRLAHLISAHRRKHRTTPVIMTGGGPGIMEAGNRGAAEAGAPSIGLNIVIPHEQLPNPWITPKFSFLFHYFAIRKMHFLMRARALVFFPGGFGTLDELFETLTLLQTGRLKPTPILLFRRRFWEAVVGWDRLVAEGMIDSQDLALFQYVETPEEAFEILQEAGALDPDGG
ncbi:MAG: LOG family protein, partial [Alphaproteobacteria bacterium]